MKRLGLLFTIALGALATLTGVASAQSLDRCCSPWDNGGFDNRNAQTSQIGFGEDWRSFGRLTFDDFWLCEGNIYQIHVVRGLMCTDAVVPKADVLLLSSCDGRPAAERGVATSIPRDFSNLPPQERGLECIYGSVEIHETGQTTPEGFRIIEVTATFPRLWLKGGQYWVSFVGFSGTADPDEQFFWGTSGNNIVKGQPGLFYDSVEGSWTSIDEICCGCTDFNFCVEGSSCKILHDNGSLDYIFDRQDPVLQTPGPGVPGSPSLQNGGRTADKVRTADDFVVPPCTNLRLCYVEAWLLTNCTRARLDIYRGDCHTPSEAPPVISVETSCLTAVRQFTQTNGGSPLLLYKAEFYNWDPIRLEPGNYWVSVYALGDGSQNSRGYFVYNILDRCEPCPISFNPGAIKGPPYDTSRWETVNPPFDFAFLVAVESAPRTLPEDPGSTTVCAADLNRDGAVTLQDLFDYLAAFFVGCP